MNLVKYFKKYYFVFCILGIKTLASYI